jgi:hypothetical protein
MKVSKSSEALLRCVDKIVSASNFNCVALQLIYQYLRSINNYVLFFVFYVWKIENFATLVKQTKIIKHDISLFPRVNLSEFPQQKTK